MDRQVGVFDALAGRLKGRFVARELDDVSERLAQATARAGGPGDEPRNLTLTRCVRELHGVPRDAGVIAFTNWRDVDASIKAVWRVLDKIVSDRAGATRSSGAWASQPDRTESEVLALLDEARNADPKLGWTPGSVLRPGVRLNQVATTKRRHVLVVALANLVSKAEPAGSIGQTVEALAGDDLDDIDDWELLSRIDDSSAYGPPELELDEPWSALKALWATKASSSATGWENHRFGSLLRVLLGASPAEVVDDEFHRRILAGPHPARETMAIFE